MPTASACIGPPAIGAPPFIAAAGSMPSGIFPANGSWAPTGTAMPFPATVPSCWSFPRRTASIAAACSPRPHLCTGPRPCGGPATSPTTSAPNGIAINACRSSSEAQKQHRRPGGADSVERILQAHRSGTDRTRSLAFLLTMIHWKLVLGTPAPERSMQPHSPRNSSEPCQIFFNSDFNRIPHDCSVLSPQLRPRVWYQA